MNLKEKQRIMIEFCFKINLLARKILEMMRKIYDKKILIDYDKKITISKVMS